MDQPDVSRAKLDESGEKSSRRKFVRDVGGILFAVTVVDVADLATLASNARAATIGCGKGTPDDDCSAISDDKACGFIGANDTDQSCTDISQGADENCTDAKGNNDVDQHCGQPDPIHGDYDKDNNCDLTDPAGVKDPDNTKPV